MVLIDSPSVSPTAGSTTGGVQAVQATPAGGLHGQRRESEQQPRRWLCDLEGLVSLPCLTLGCAMIIVPPDHAVIRESIVKHLASKKRDYIMCRTRT